jgi:multiple sugar transport system substrate-binding protein
MDRKWLAMGKQVGIFLFAVTVAVGCSSNQASTGSGGQDGGASKKQADAAAPAKPPEPVKISMFNRGNTPKASFELMKAGVEKKYPFITFELVENEKGSTFEDLLAARTLPDIIYGKVTEKEGALIDLAPLIKKHNFDVNRIDPYIWQAYVYITNTDKKLIIPWQANMQVMYYNKDIFNKFGVAYPKDGMTWDETYELAKKLSRNDNGTKYMGFNLRAGLNFSQSQLALPYFDDKTGKSAVNTDGWKQYFANFSRFFQIPGNELTAGKSELDQDAVFSKDKRVAMYAAHPQFPQLVEAEKGGLNWDLVSLPYFPAYPKQGTQPNTNGFGITITSKHPDEAFMAIEALLSDDVQLLKDKELASGPVLKDNKEIMKVFGQGFGLTGKNVAASVFNSFAPSPKPNEYNEIISSIPVKYFKQVVQDGADINTALRGAEDEMNKKIAEYNATK